MLKARVLTAVALLMVLLPALFRAPQWLWVAVGLLVVAVAAWEWGRLLNAPASHQKGFAVFFVLLCLVLGLLDPASVGMGGSRDNPYVTL
ncbi:MAG: hypothetical protein RIR18_2277, partial [Pseudomonadota bacterium]